MLLQKSSTYKQISSDQFNAFIQGGNFTGVIVFASDWTGGATMLHSIVEKMAREYQALPIRFCSIDPELASKIAEEYRVNGHLTVFFFRKSVLIDQIVGMPAKKLFREKVESLIES